MNSVNISLRCNNSCGLKLHVSLMEGASLPHLPSICPKCNSGMVEIDRITTIGEDIRSEDRSNHTVDVHPDQNSFDLTPTPAIIEFRGEIPTRTGGSNILTAFHGRMTQAILIMQTLVKMGGGNNTGGVVLDVEEVIERIEGTLSRLHNHLFRIEEECHIGRGERLSVAFPISQGSRKIMFRTWLGIDLDKREVTTDGTLMASMVEAISAKEITVTEYERRVSDIPDIEDYLLSLERPHKILGEKRPYLPVFYEKWMTIEILAKMHMVWPDEYDHLIHLLSLVQKATLQNPKEGWDSNDYAQQETALITEGNGHGRWGDRYVKYLNSAKRRRKRYPEAIAFDKMVTNINSTLGGTIGRMKELGLVRPVRVGGVKNLLVTDRGNEAIGLHQENEFEAIWRGA